MIYNRIQTKKKDQLDLIFIINHKIKIQENLFIYLLRFVFGLFLIKQNHLKIY
jgi:hypothetical protein